jgi:hypothetical protein
VLGVVTGISVSLLAVTRLPWTGPMIGLDGRYLTDVALVAVVCLALASMPMRGGLDAALNPAQSAESPEAAETAHAAPVRRRTVPARRARAIERRRRRKLRRPWAGSSGRRARRGDLDGGPHGGPARRPPGSRPPAGTALGPRTSPRG